MLSPSGGSVRSVIEAACRTETALAAGWGDPHSDGTWVTVAHPGAAVPSQGWKLHVSATVRDAGEVLRRVLPVLMDEVSTFKVAASTQRLAELNRGDCGASQVGKFVTVYPLDEGQAVRLALVLDRVTAGLSGPRVPSDRALHPQSLVHYRYGAFVAHWMQTALGEVVGAIDDPDGRLEPDRRTRWYRAPAWARDPFVAAGLCSPPPAVDLLVAGRYLTAAILGSTPDVTVRLVVDLEGGERRVLKEARGGGTSGAHALLHHEARVLARLADEPHTPAAHDLFEQGESLFLVMDHIAGLTLEQHVRALAADGLLVPVEQVAAWATTLAEVLGRMHDRGMSYGDLKPPHVIVTPDGGLFLVDLESVWPALPDTDSAVLGTPGYTSPERMSRSVPSVGDDVHALGATLYFMLTGVEPSLAPDRRRLLDRPLGMLNPSVPEGVVELVRRCLDTVAAARPASMRQFCALLGAALYTPSSVPARDAGTAAFDSVARGIAAKICRGTTWDNEVPARRDIDGGLAGVVLALAQAAPELDVAELWVALRARARWLASSSPLPGGPLPGLYVGEAGVGAALLRAGQALADDALLAAAVEKARLVAALPPGSPDLFNGTAGRLRFHLMLWDATQGQEHLDAALAAGERLTATAERPERDQAEWAIPPGYEGASGLRYLGYAHGVAGIADALLDLFEATGHKRFRDMAAAGGRRLAALAVPVLGDGSGRDWPDHAGGSRGGALWCHGAAGVTRFLVHAARVELFPGAADLADAGARAAAAARSTGPGQCHGLAGNADVLVDAYRTTGDRSHLDRALVLGRLLRAFVVEPDGLDPPSPGAIRSDDLMNGWAGLLTCVLRLAAPDRLGHVLDVRPGHVSVAGLPSRLATEG
ncbi:MAG: lanthionine synthetase LanC family protein [Acidimicrobiales bacterium]